MRSGLGRLVFFVFWNTALFVHWLIWLWYLILPDNRRFVDAKLPRSPVKSKKIQVPDGDVLIISGDLTIGAVDENAGIKQLSDLNEWAGEFDFSHRIAIAGNHDRCCIYDKNLVKKTLSNFTYLEDEELEIEGIKIYASPISLKNNGWSVNTAFQLERNGDNVKDKYEALLKKYPKEGDIDILITHGPPHGFRDRNWFTTQCGCKSLRAFVEHLKPLYHIFGHVHESYGVDHNSATTFINASSVNMVNWPNHKPIVFDVTVPK